MRSSTTGRPQHAESDVDAATPVGEAAEGRIAEAVVPTWPALSAFPPFPLPLPKKAPYRWVVGAGRRRESAMCRDARSVVVFAVCRWPVTTCAHLRGGLFQP